MMTTHKTRTLSFFNTLTIFLAVVCVYFLVGLPKNQLALAQSSVGVSGISIEANPASPGPNTSVSVNLKSFSVDLNRSVIVWYEDGAVRLSGKGETGFSFTTGPIGSQSTIRAVIQGGPLGITSQELSFTPAEVDLLWEAPNSYTPPFYKGKALPASESVIYVVALPWLSTSGKDFTNTKDYIYKWKRNYTYSNFNDQSGYGKNDLLFRKDLLRKNEVVEVEIYSTSGNLLIKNQFVTSDTDPEILLYKNLPLEGVRYEQAIGEEASFTENEFSLVAEPYFFSSLSRNGSLVFDWKLKGSPLPDEKNQGSVTFNRSGGTTGQYKISLDVKSVSRILQFASRAMTLIIPE